MIHAEFKKKNGVSWIQIEDIFNNNRIRLLFTYREGGCSSYPYDSLNLATHVGDDYANVMSNREKVLDLFELNTDHSICAEQTHSDTITSVTKQDLGKGSNCKHPIPESDGLITTEQDVALLSFYADCVPIYVWDISNDTIGIAHAGWKGTVLDIAGKMVENFITQYQSKKENIKVAIGPSICKNCYEVDINVINSFKSVFSKKEMDVICNTKQNGKYLLDLRNANELLILRKNILPENIIMMNQCTYCNPDLFFSYRYESGRTGRMAAIITRTEVR